MSPPNRRPHAYTGRLCSARPRRPGGKWESFKIPGSVVDEKRRGVGKGGTSASEIARAHLEKLEERALAALRRGFELRAEFLRHRGVLDRLLLPVHVHGAVDECPGLGPPPHVRTIRARATAPRRAAGGNPSRPRARDATCGVRTALTPIRARAVGSVARSTRGRHCE